MSAVERAGDRAVRRVIARLAERLRAEMPDVQIEERGDGVAVGGRGIGERLRWPAGLLR